MCGIAGFIDPRGPRDQERDRALAAAMAESLRHRGPDSNGVWTDPAAPVALGFRRLAIIDPGPEGDQPMSSAGGRYQLVFNGEIYNHRALRAELEAAGRREWRGESDTEVLIEAIANWGLRPALAKLNGMFALAVWDRERRVLFLARDRLGEKPLYYGRQDGVFLFASEAKALKRHPAWRGEVDREALALYLRHAYVPAPHSAWRGILKLAPGTLLEVGADGVHGAVEAYWRAEERAAEAVAAPFVGDEAEAIGRLDRLIADSVALRMVTDVPVGAFLSGGIDSSTVVAALREMGRVRTFSIGFAEAEYDESRQAAAVARHLGTDHTELRVGEDECLATLPSLAEVYDEPFADASQIGIS